MNLSSRPPFLTENKRQDLKKATLVYDHILQM